MFLRKLFVFIISSFVTALLLTFLIVVLDGGYNVFGLGLFLFILAFSSPILLVLGMPITALSDFILENKQGKERLLKALASHLFFGFFFGILLSYIIGGNFYIVASMLASIIVWSIDELIRFVKPA
ncbi:hypothetical protein CIB95_14305 [Lottiidibacillus patelloidae]|uniref:Major facilitator superfamily (MFS) profile domain-containing protein n=1 Tax=Lottiidibacillus patelloidae TaxID=2670334 RepID=A0A263BQM7_9BACI|nr:hypothetical protein [Lottiidibacillus patelloidae]OZM56011.1 hypothetical protein CIB95_14305 [Lottiidibacillus patelloidae]